MLSMQMDISSLMLTATMELKWLRLLMNGSRLKSKEHSSLKGALSLEWVNSLLDG
jgi:hypothetical protein